MRVIITGGTGFLGLRLAHAILEKNSLVGSSGKQEIVDEIILFDTAAPPNSYEWHDKRVKVVVDDISNKDILAEIISGNSLSVFHLASVVSAEAENDFDLAVNVNINGGLNVLEACRQASNCARLVVSSSLAVFGGSNMPDVVSDDTKITPMTTYGMTKLTNELLLSDYTRKGFVDGRGARLPTVVIRPGKPNKAASGFASGIFREPIAGLNYSVPVNRKTRMAITGYRNVIKGILKLHETESSNIGDDRTINLPSISVTVDEMITTLHRVAGNQNLGNISESIDPNIQKICDSWPGWCKADRAQSIGLPTDKNLDSIVDEYIEDYAKI